MSDLTDAIYEIEKAVEKLCALDDISLDRDELESRLSDLENQARGLADTPAASLADAVESLADAIHELYVEV